MKIPSLILLILLWPILAWTQAPIYRQFFTTNVNPIVDVVAGSNATVVATTPASNIRRFTVSSTATGGGQTNITVVKPDDGSVVISTNIAAGISTYGVGLSTVLTNKMYGSNVIGVVPEANNAVNATNLYNANLPIPTNTPAAGKVITATSAVSSEWGTASGGVPSTSEIMAILNSIASSNAWRGGESVIIADNFFGSAIVSPLTTGVAGGGSVAASDGPSGALSTSWWAFTAYPTNTGSYSLVRGSANGKRFTESAAFDASLAVSGFESTQFKVGFMSVPTTLATTDEMVWLANTNWSANWIAAVSVNSALTSFTSSIPVAANSVLRLSINAFSTNSVGFYTNGVLAGSIATTPGGRALSYSCRTYSLVSTGTDTAQRLYLDWLWLTLK